MTPARGGVATQRRPATRQRPSTSAATARQVLDDYDIHPAANMFPMLDDAELAALATDIADHGQQEPIWMHQGQLLDGRNRLVAATIARIEPTFQDWTPRPNETPTTFVLSRNLLRRHLSASQRAALAVEVEAIIAAENKAARKRGKDPAVDKPLFSHTENPKPEIALSKTPGARVEFLNEPEDTPIPGQKSKSARVITGRARDQAAQTMRVSAGYVNDAKDLAKAAPETFAKVKAGELSIAAAQDEVVEQAQATGRLSEVQLRPGAVRAALDRLGERTVPKKAPLPRISLPKFSKVESSRTTVAITATFGNPKIAEEWLNRLQDDPKCLDMSYEVVNAPPRKRATKKTP